MANFVAEQPLDLDPNLMEGVRNLILGITQPFNQPFARELWVLDPLAQLAAVTVPVLVLIGKKDIQVDWQADGSLFATLAETHANVEVVFVPDANHVLKHEARPRETLNAAEATAELQRSKAKCWILRRWGSSWRGCGRSHQAVEVRLLTSGPAGVTVSRSPPSGVVSWAICTGPSTPCWSRMSWIRS